MVKPQLQDDATPRASDIRVREQRVAVFGDEHDKARWAAWLSAEHPTHEWFSSVASALVELRTGDYDLAFVPSCKQTVSALSKLAFEIPIVVADQDLAEGLPEGRCFVATHLARLAEALRGGVHKPDSRPTVPVPHK
jgi:hypothetical protein